MKLKTFTFSLLCCFFFCLTAFKLHSNKREYDTLSIQSIPYEKTDSLYSQVVESILLDMKKRYGENYQDSMQRAIFEIRDQLIGTTMDNFTFSDINGEGVELEAFQKPIVLEVSASWCGPCVASTDVINDLSKKYADQLAFLVLAHDVGERAVQYAAKFKDEHVTFVPSVKNIDIMAAIKLQVGGFNHLFPFPTAYFLDQNLRIVDIRIGGSLAGEFPDPDGGMMTITKEQAYQDNLKILQSGIDKIVLR